MPPARTYTVTCAARGVTLGDRIEEAADFAAKGRGLLGRDGLAPGGGLLLRDCRSIHMFFMRFAIDVVYLSPQLTVAKIVRALPPWAMSWGGLQPVAHTLELPANLAALDALQVGDALTFTANPAQT